MSNPYRRYEILLPLRFNDGRRVPDELIGETLIKLRDQFGAVSAETQTIQGQWFSQGQLYRDDLVRVFVDVADAPQHREFFESLKEQLKASFDLGGHLDDDLPARRHLNVRQGWLGSERSEAPSVWLAG